MWVSFHPHGDPSRPKVYLRLRFFVLILIPNIDRLGMTNVLLVCGHLLRPSVPKNSTIAELLQQWLNPNIPDLLIRTTVGVLEEESELSYLPATWIDKEESVIHNCSSDCFASSHSCIRRGKKNIYNWGGEVNHVGKEYLLNI